MPRYRITGWRPGKTSCFAVEAADYVGAIRAATAVKGADGKSRIATINSCVLITDPARDRAAAIAAYNGA